MKAILIILSLLSFLFSKDIKINSNATTSAFFENKFILSTDNGIVKIYDQNLSFLFDIKLPKIKDFFGKPREPKVYMSDLLNGKFLILAEASFGKRELYIWDSGLKKLPIENLSIKKANFINENEILIALLGNEIMLYDIEKNSFSYRFQISTSTFSDFALNEKRDKFALSCESGIVYLINSKNGKTIKEYKKIHKDNVYQVAFYGDFIVSAGADRKMGIINIKTQKQSKFEADFLVYSVGIGKKYAAFMQNENSDIAIINLENLEKTAVLKGHKAIINSINFINENEIISSADEKQIKKWSIKWISQA